MTNQEINEAVARKLGWTYDEKFQDWGNPQDEKMLLPDYCGSIAAAWEIVEHVKLPMQLGNNCVVKGSEWYCFWWDNKNNREYREHADTAPMAICLAFLKLGEASAK
jgi:Phage ABA sandwich domain